MTDRIQLILKSMNLSPSQFADAISVQRSSLSHILSGRNKPSLDFVSKVLTSYPDIRSDWLLFGTGTMMRKAKKEQSVPIEEALPAQPPAAPEPEPTLKKTAKESQPAEEKEKLWLYVPLCFLLNIIVWYKVVVGCYLTLLKGSWS